MNAKKRKRIRILGKILFVLYVIFIIYFLIFSDWYGRTGEMQEYHYNLELFKEIRRFWEYRDQVGMFAMFTTVFYSFGLSLCVETFQLLTKVGSFDVDDLLLNTIGGLVGYLIFSMCAAVRRRHDHKKKTKNRRR